MATTYGQMVYSILDELKLFSDDATYTEDHVLFIISKYRAFVFKKEYEDKEEDEIPDSYKQTLCIDVEETPAIDGEPCTGGYYLKSTTTVPDPLTDECKLLVSPVDYFQGAYLTFITKNRMRFVGHNKYMQNIIYAALGPDNYLYLKSNNPQFLYLRQIKVTGIFEDAESAAEYECDANQTDEDGNCIQSGDIMDKAFPMEEALIPEVIELALKELLGAAYRPRDERNDAKDNLSEVATQAAT